MGVEAPQGAEVEGEEEGREETPPLNMDIVGVEKKEEEEEAAVVVPSFLYR